MIRKILRNKKYIGNVMLQKTYAEDLFFSKQVESIGPAGRYLIQNHHPAITSRDLFEAAGANSYKEE